MAARFWVGGTGTWDATTTANWSATSGGAGGASVPGAADDVTINTASITVTTDYNVSVISVTINATAATLSLGGTLTCSGAITLTAGTFTTNNFDVTALNLSSSNTNTRTINLGSSTVTLNNTTATNINFATSTGLTFNAGTSQINIIVAGPTINTGGQTFYNVAFTSTATANATRTIVGSGTFNNLSVAAPASAGVITVTFSAQQTITGTLSTTGTAGNRRVFFTTANYGISYDLVVNSAPSLTDADFRGLYVRGTSAPISGTRIGNRGECRGITFSTPKTVYWNLGGSQNWSANAWATTATGTPSTDNFPLPQDIATFTNAGSVSLIGIDSAIGYVPNVDMSGRTNSASVAFIAANICYGNWTNGSGVTLSGTSTLTFSGGITQTITSSGKTFSCPITIDTYGGIVQLADALNIGSNALTVTNGIFDTANQNITAQNLDVGNATVRTIYLRASTITASITGTSTTNLTFNAGTSTIVGTTGIALAFYDANISVLGNSTNNFYGSFRNATITHDGTAGLAVVVLPTTGVSISGTLTVTGTSAIARVGFACETLGTQTTLSVATLASLSDADFTDILFSGAAAPATGTRLGDCGGNSGITFPSPKTVYWNLAGAQNWYSAGWAATSGGSPATNNFPLPQDTATFNNTGSVTGTITIPYYANIGTMDASARTTAMTLSNQGLPYIFGDFKLGTGVTTLGTGNAYAFAGRGTQTITSNGRTFVNSIFIYKPFSGSPTVQLADALTISAANTFTLSSGTFDAVTYNVSAGTVTLAASTICKMGTGTWTCSSTATVGGATVWSALSSTTLIVSTANIVLSGAASINRTFAGGGLYYNKLTIGGGSSTGSVTFSGNNTFSELASTKTVAYTIAFGTSVQTFGKWSVTGTVGNVVTLTGTSTTNVIAGPAVTGVDYLAMGSWGVSTTSPGEFYAGANSTGTAAAPVFRTAAPAPRTLYWVGGTGNWSSTTKWDTTSGGGGGAAIPTSLDAVNFDAMSNATAYTATIDAGVTLARCASFTMAGPLVGNVTFAGSVGIAFHGNVSFAATGITRTYTGAMQCAGGASYTFTTNGLTLGAACTVIGIGSTWTLGSNISIGGSIFTITYGTFSTSASNYGLTLGRFDSNNNNVRSISLNASTITTTSLGTTTTISMLAVSNLTFNAGTSTFSLQATTAGISSGGLTFNNVNFTSAATPAITITGTNTFNTLSFASQTTVGISNVTFSANQTITTLTLGAGTASAYRTFLASNTIGTTRTLTVGTLTAGAADIDFRNITIAGAAAPISGTRFGDAKGNSGITFGAAKTVYWAVNTANWGATGAGSWSATSGGAAANTQFPLAQDTAYIPFATPTSGSTITVNDSYNIGTLDMNERNGSALLTLATGSQSLQIYGNWINGTGTTLSGTGAMTFAGRTTQQITSAGKTFTQAFTINTPGGSVTLQDAFTVSVNINAFTLTAGTFDASTYAFTTSGTGVSVGVTSSNSNTRTLAIGSGTWTIAGSSSPWSTATSTNLTVTGTGTISLTSASGKTFSGGGANYSGITLNQGGAGTLAITGNNTFANITNTYSATGATTISLGSTTQTLTQPWTATGEAGRVLTVSGTSAASPATLIFSGSGTAANVDYLAINNVRAYNLTDTWYAGANSTNGGTLGWVFATKTVVATYLGNFFAFF
jgi:hypothetical protein